jgi:hypothetical protein
VRTGSAAAQHFADGSVIAGHSLYAKTDGSAGLAGDVSFAYEVPLARGAMPGELLLH